MYKTHRIIQNFDGGEHRVHFDRWATNDDERDIIDYVGVPLMSVFANPYKYVKGQRRLNELLADINRVRKTPIILREADQAEAEEAAKDKS